MPIVPATAGPIDAICPFCEAPSRESFRGTVLGRYQAIYAECGSCRSLHVVDPTWLVEAYADPACGDALDTGAPWRNEVLVALMLRLGVEAPVGPWLDYGSGQGLLVAELGRRGIAIHAHDPPREIFAAGEPYALAGCFEVLEHQLAPRAMLFALRHLLRASGIVALSTWLRESCHGPSWPYLAPEGGQHVSFASMAGLRAACASADLPWWCSGSNRTHPQLQVHLCGLGEPRGLDALERSGFTVFARA